MFDSNVGRWVGFAILLAGTIALSIYLKGHGEPLCRAGYAIGKFELAFTQEKAKEIVNAWGEANVNIARADIHLDFAFIACYSLLLAMVCNAAASHLHGAWQTAGVVLAWGMLGAGLLDCLENAGMLMMLDGNYGPVLWVSICAATKFALALFGLTYILAAHLVR